MKTVHLIGALLCLTLTLIVCSTPVSSSKILVLVFFSSKSHKITYMRLIEELASRGHEITVVSPIKQDKPIKNIKEVFTLDIQPFMSQINFFESKEKGQQLNPLVMLEMMSKVCSSSYDLPHVRALLDETFDLIFLQPFFNECVLGMAHKLKAPTVLFTPAGIPNGIVSAVGGHFPPSFVPHLMLGYGDEMTFYQRFINLGVNALMELLKNFLLIPKAQSIYREKLGDSSIPSVMEILGNTSLVLSNRHFSIHGPQPYLPDIIDVGGIHSRPAKPLPKDLEDFVSKSGADGFIFFSMGSAVKADQMPQYKKKIFLKVFSQLKQQVIWKWESDSMEGEVLPKNVKLSKWLPQQDLLGHPKIKAFLTHCGGGSTEESIFHGVPIVGLPMFADQIMNAQHAKNMGFSVELDWNDITEDSLTKAIQEVLENPKYVENAKRISHIFRDQPDDPLKRGVFWIEYVLRHKGAPHLRSASRKLNFFQYHSYDVIVTYLSLVTLLLYLIYTLVRLTCKCVCGSKNKTKSSIKIKQN